MISEAEFRLPKPRLAEKNICFKNDDVSELANLMIERINKEASLEYSHISNAIFRARNGDLAALQSANEKLQTTLKGYNKILLENLQIAEHDIFKSISNFYFHINKPELEEAKHFSSTYPLKPTKEEFAQTYPAPQKPIFPNEPQEVPFNVPEPKLSNSEYSNAGYLGGLLLIVIIVSIYLFGLAH